MRHSRKRKQGKLKKNDYENLPIQYIEIFLLVKIENFIGKNLIFLIFFAQYIDCGYRLEPPLLTEAVLTCTHNLCFG